MRAVLCHEFGPIESLKIEEIDPPLPNAKQVLISVQACGMNYPDVLMAEGKYQSIPPFPFSPGTEVAGIIEKVGADVLKYRPGQPVVATVWAGGLAEKVVASEDSLRTVPKGMDLVTAAGISVTYGTSYYALKQRARLRENQTLLVLGAAGGVGISAVELGNAMGAKVIAAASSDEKLEIAKKAGAAEIVNYSDGNLKDKVKAITNGLGADVIYDPIGGPLFDQCMRCVAWEGRVLVIGFVQGIPKVPTNLALLKGCEIVGVFFGDWTRRDPKGADENLAELQKMFEAKTLQPLIGKVYDFEDFSHSLEDLKERRAMGKLVVTVGSS
ncbi:NADPH:quinone oxidoreductase family protein [Myxococcota bacterium]|nr:NADPH:quinone oxidoreductase family protein [Myxococcota bacterium]